MDDDEAVSCLCITDESRPPAAEPSSPSSNDFDVLLALDTHQVYNSSAAQLISVVPAAAPPAGGWA